MKPPLFYVGGDRNLKKLFLVFGCSAALNTHAFHISKLDNGVVDFDRNTRVFAVGYSGGMGDLFVKSASARARRYQQLFPEDQILILRNKENANDVGAWDTYLGFQVYETGSARLSGEKLVEFLTKFKPGVLKSLDVFSHSSPQIGMGLEKGVRSDYFSSSTINVERLKWIFAEGAYANIHGCNGGYTQAPALSKLWEVPVSGAFSGTDFQRLNNDGTWYFNNAGQYPSNSGWASRNILSFDTPQSWMRGSYRMKPQNAPYRGVWGYLQVGLPFNKFFCSYDGASEDDCARSMKESLMGFISTQNLKAESSFESYKKVVQDFLCPVNVSVPSVRENCVAALEESESNPNVTYASFRGGIDADCDMKSCKVSLHCETVDGSTKCKTGDEAGNPLPPNPSPRTIIDEYHRYLRGYELSESSLAYH